MARRERTELNLPTLDELFTTQEERDDAKLKRIYEIPLDEIDDFPDHPFKVIDDEDMFDLVESVKEYGIITPATVRKKEDGRYELLSGHRRKRACELAGLDTLRAEIVEMDRDSSIIFMVDSNLQRTTILPSEKGFSYKMRLEAMKRQGKRTDLTSVPSAQKLKGKTSRQILGEEVGESQDYLAKQNDEFFVRYLKYIEEPSLESFREYLDFLINFNYAGEDIDENAIKIMAQRIIDEKIEEKCFDDFMTYGWYDDSKITNLINLNALSELIYSIKDRYMVFNENITYIHDDIREYEATIKNELSDHNINIVFQDSKTSEMLQIVDNFVSIIRHAYNKMIMHIRDKEQWGISSEWDMKLAAKLLNIVSISNIKFTVPMCDWAAAICTERMFSIDYPKHQRNNMFFNGFYVDALLHIQTSLAAINQGSIKSVFDTLDR